MAPDQETGRIDPIMGLAYLACAMRQPKTTADLDADVAREYLRARFILSDRSMAARVAAAVPLRAVVREVGYEESSRRFVMTFVAEHGDGEEETVRSDRTDGAAGGRVRRMWTQDLAGRRVIIYKCNEAAGRDPARGSGYRVAPLIQIIG